MNGGYDDNKTKWYHARWLHLVLTIIVLAGLIILVNQMAKMDANRKGTLPKEPLETQMEYTYGQTAGVNVITGTGSVALTWTPSTDPTVIGYRLYYGIESHRTSQTGYQMMNITVGQIVSINDIAPGVPYYFDLMAVNAAGIESLPSNELVFTFTLPTPSPSPRPPTPSPRPSPPPTASPRPPVPTVSPQPTVTPVPTASPVPTPSRTPQPGATAGECPPCNCPPTPTPCRKSGP